ncbi:MULTISPECIES: inositol monophosphatase family protein [Salinibaculum]|uniref:inositol monophosphatase family protein n=1 Tax=Salinibaculum TaxID=2732368 RepID=UPI0030CA77E4
MPESAAVARDAVTAAADYLRDRFAGGALDADFSDDDVKAIADHEAEQRVMDIIEDAFPDHSISAEESGAHPGREDRRWVVDALDGTNNFAAGVPTFGVAATLVDDEGPRTTAVAVPVLNDVYVATRGGGVTYNGAPVTAADGNGVPPSHATVVSIIGPPVIEGDDLRREHREMVAAVRGECKRVIETWAPVVYWGLLARGRVGGYLCFHPAEREQVAGELLARESGCVERSAGPLSVFARDEATRDAIWDAVA